MVVHVFNLPRRRNGKNFLDGWRSMSPSEDVHPVGWEMLESLWDSGWQGSPASSSIHSGDGPCYPSVCRNEDCGGASHSSWSIKWLLAKVQPWIRELQDARRGVIYTKSGPCNLLEDWPIPAYPEDYDWNSY